MPARMSFSKLSTTAKVGIGVGVAAVAIGAYLALRGGSKAPVTAAAQPTAPVKQEAPVELAKDPPQKKASVVDHNPDVLLKKHAGDAAAPVTVRAEPAAPTTVGDGDAHDAVKETDSADGFKPIGGDTSDVGGVATPPVIVSQVDAAGSSPADPPRPEVSKEQLVSILEVIHKHTQQLAVRARRHSNRIVTMYTQ